MCMLLKLLLDLVFDGHVCVHSFACYMPINPNLQYVPTSSVYKTWLYGIALLKVHVLTRIEDDPKEVTLLSSSLQLYFVL